MNLNVIQEVHDSLKREEAAAILRVSVRTVDRLISDGELPAAKIGRAVRVSREDVLNLLSPTTPAPAGPHSPGAGVFLSSPAGVSSGDGPPGI